MAQYNLILNQLMDTPTDLVPIDTGLYSANTGDIGIDPYQKEAMIYDSLIGNPFYNRIIWGNWPRVYTEFAREAVNSGSGPLLDAAGGTLVFSADVFLQTERPIVVVDQSISMLRKAQARLIKKNGCMPEHIILIQGDLLNLPFHNSIFDTVLSLGLLHLFDDIEPLLNRLNQYLTQNGEIYMTSLVAETTLGTAYLKLLQKSGKIAHPKSANELERFLTKIFTQEVHFHSKKNMAYIQSKKQPPQHALIDSHCAQIDNIAVPVL